MTRLTGDDESVARRRDDAEATSWRTRCPTRQSRPDTKTTMAKAKAEPELKLRRPELERRAKTAERRRDESRGDTTRPRPRGVGGRELTRLADVMTKMHARRRRS